VTINEAKSVTATFEEEVETPPSEALCTGEDIVGAGSSLQREAQDGIWIPGFQGPGGVCAGRGTEPQVSYEPTGSGGALEAWGFEGGSFDTSRAFIGTDGAPTSAQIGNAKSAAGGSSQVLVIPVAQTAIAVLADPPANCTVTEITNGQLQEVFRGTRRRWDQIDTAHGAGCEGAKITRVVRPDGSGTTYQFKHYLSLINNTTLSCVAGTQSWTDIQPIGPGGGPNTVWPENGAGGCRGNQLSPVVTANQAGGGALVAKVNSTPGSIGYAAVADVEEGKAGSTHALALQNNGIGTSLGKAHFASPVVSGGEAANCQTAQYNVPTAGQLGGSGENVDWSGVYGAKLGSGGDAYPLCTLTWDVALKGYSAAGFSPGVETTVSDYLRAYVTADAGQGALEAMGRFYAPLPPSTKPSRDVLSAARLAASKIAP
jgi:ABC-type phosphate transport system substrate-binding protein